MYGGRESTFTPGPVHRLDRNTSGIVIFGKTLAALQDLNEMMKKRHHIEKSYMTICKGKLTKQQELVGYVKKIDNEEITYDEYYKNVPSGYECWSCSYCGKWTGNLKHY